MNGETTKVNIDSHDDIPAEEYENLSRKFIPGYDGLYSLAQILLAESVPANANVLIVGAGGGKEVVTFGKAMPNATFTGVDPSKTTLGAARELVEKANLQGRVQLHHGTIDELDETRFDAATALLVMHFLPDDGAKLNFLKAIHERLKPGARFILADGCYDKNPAEFEWLLDVFVKHAQLKGAPPEAIAGTIKTISESVHSVPAERELELLREAKFGEVESFFQGWWIRAWVAARL